MTVCSNIKCYCCSSNLILKLSLQNPPEFDRPFTAWNFSHPKGKAVFTYREAGCVRRYLTCGGVGYKLSDIAPLIYRWLLITLYF